jgi:hypothetical protein
MYVIMKGSQYVALPGSERSYTNDFDRARQFSSKAIAEANACSNERVVPLRMTWYL